MIKLFDWFLLHFVNILNLTLIHDPTAMSWTGSEFVISCSEIQPNEGQEQRVT